jgi:hypothetical protein
VTQIEPNGLSFPQLPAAPHRPGLRAGRERPRSCRAAKRRYQLAPSDGDWHVTLPCEGAAQEEYHAETMRSCRFGEGMMSSRVNCGSFASSGVVIGSCKLTRVNYLKVIAFVAAAIPLFLFIRAIFFQRPTRINEGLKEFKKQANLAVSIFLFLIGCVVVFAVGKLVWTWWKSL